MTEQTRINSFLIDLKVSSQWERKHSSLCAIAHFAEVHGRQKAAGLIPEILNILRHDFTEIEYKRDHDMYLFVFVKRAALDALKMIGERGNIRLTQIATELIFDSSWMIRCGAIDLLAAVDDNVERLINQLLLAYQDADPEVRKCCIRNLQVAFSSLNKHHKPLHAGVLNILFTALTDPEYYVRSEAKISMKIIVDSSKLANEEIASIASRMTDAQDEIRETARELCKSFLGHTDKNGVVARALILQLQNTSLDQVTRAEAAEILFQMHTAGNLKKNMLCEFLCVWGLDALSFADIHCARIRHPSPEVRKHSISALQQLNDELECILQEDSHSNKEDSKRVPAVSCLGNISGHIRDALLVALRDSDDFVITTSIDCVCRGKFKDDGLIIECLLDLLKPEINTEITVKAIHCLGQVTRSKVLAVKSALSHLNEKGNTRIRKALCDIESIFNEECECLRTRLFDSSWDDKLFCIRQLTRKYSRRGPCFVQRWCWNDESAPPGDCVLAVVRHCLKLYLSLADMRRQAPLVGREGVSLGDEAAWRQLEHVFACTITIIDAFTLNVIRDSPGRNDPSVAPLETQIRILVLNGHAYCFEPDVNEQQIGMNSTVDFECEHSIISALVEMLHHEDDYVQVCAVTALGAIAKRGDSAVLAGLLGFFQSEAGKSVLGSQAAIRALAQISNPGCRGTVKALFGILMHDNVELQGMSIWAIGQVARNYHDLDSEAELGRCIRHRLSEIAASAVLESSSQLEKIAKWALTRIFSSCVESSNDSDFQLRAQGVEIPKPDPDGKHEEINLTPEFNCNKARSCLSSNHLRLTAALRCELLSNLSIHTTKTVLKAVSDLNKLDIYNEQELLNSLFLCLENENYEVRKITMEAIIIKAVPELASREYYELLMRSITEHKYDDVVCPCMVALGKSSVPGDKIISCFAAKQILDKVFTLTRTSKSKYQRGRLLKEYNFISTALHVLTGLEEAGSQRLQKVAFACASIDSKVVQDEVMNALDKAIVACDADDYVLNSCLRILEKRDGLYTFALSMLHRLGASGGHRANLCLATFSQQKNEALWHGPTLDSGCSASAGSLAGKTPPSDVTGRTTSSSTDQINTVLQNQAVLPSPEAFQLSQAQTTSKTQQTFQARVHSQDQLQQSDSLPKAFIGKRLPIQIDNQEKLGHDCMLLLNGSTGRDKLFSFSRYGKIMDRSKKKP